MTEDDTPSLGSIIRHLRSSNDWTLAQMSKRVQIPLSTLAKIEQNRLTLSYDKLVLLSAKLDMRLSDLLNLTEKAALPTVNARRSVGSLKNALDIDTRNYDYKYFCTELRAKLMIPLVSRLHCRSIEDFGPLVRHSGEEFIYVLEGAIEVHSEYYDPVRLDENEYIYLDSEMGHAYILAEGFSEATVLGVCASRTDNLQQKLIEQARSTIERASPDHALREPDPAPTRRPRRPTA